VAQMIEKRLDVLETTHGIGGGGPRCPECGGFPESEPSPEDSYKLVFACEDEEMLEESTYCPTCGGPIDIVIKFEEDLYVWPQDGRRRRRPRL
jgi:hypothetical protein